jgi:hypothetical protein
MTTPDLDARVAEAEAAWELADAQCRMLNVDEQIALMGTLRDLHAALQAREGGEFDCWAVYYPSATPNCGDELSDIRRIEHDPVLCKSEMALGYTVRRLRCRVVEGE